MEIAIMVEGQMGLTWARWQRIVPLVEELGFAGLFRSDHFTNAQPPDSASLELWVSLTWLAANTQRIEFGPLVTPFSFRSPVFTARMGKDVDDLSNGRLVLGIGAGWQAREHEMFGFPLLDVAERFDRFTEGVEITHRLLNAREPVSFDGAHYHLREAHLLPPSQRPGGPRLLIGGNGEKRTLPLVAKYAGEWNAVLIPPSRFIELNGLLDELLRAEGRAADAVRRSLMTGLIFGRDDAALRANLYGRDLAKERTRGIVAGTPSAVRDQLAALAEAGVERVMLQWLDLDDTAGLEDFARAVL
jgi:F420-dependent oxidoreductase-like protein